MITVSIVHRWSELIGKVSEATLTPVSLSRCLSRIVGLDGRRLAVVLSRPRARKKARERGTVLLCLVRRGHVGRKSPRRVQLLETELAPQEVFGFLDEDVAADVGDGVGEGNAFGTYLHAVLREAAFLDAAIASEGAEAVFLEDFAGGVVVEELDLGDGGCADEACVVIELRADFHAAAATDAVGKRVAGFLLLGEDAGAGTQVIGAVDGDPGFDGLEVFEEDRAVYLEVADERELAERLDLDGLFEIIDEGGAGHTGLAVDPHRT